MTAASAWVFMHAVPDSVDAAAFVLMHEQVCIIAQNAFGSNIACIACYGLSDHAFQEAHAQQ